MFNYVELIQDNIGNRGNIVTIDTKPTSNKEVYRSVYLFSQDFKDYVNKNKSKNSSGIAGYKGIVSIDYIPLDFDGDVLSTTLDLCKKYIQYLSSYWHIDCRRLKYYFSGSKGFHILIPADMILFKPSVDLPNQIKNFVRNLNTEFKEDYSSDLSIYDRTRAFRVENTINQKSGLYKIQLLYNEIISLTAEQICILAKEPRTLTLPSIKIKTNKILQELFEKNEVKKEPIKQKEESKIVTRGKLCYAQILQGVKEGFRDNCALRLATHFRKEGMDYDTTLAAMLKWNEKNQPPMQDEEIERKTLSAYNVDYDFGCNDDILQNFCSEECILKGNKDKYNKSNQELERRILNYLKKARAASKTSIELAVTGTKNTGVNKIIFDTVFSNMVEEEKIIKSGLYEFSLPQEMAWIDTPFTEGEPINFEIPFFSEYCRFNWGSLIIIGSQNKYGKTTFAMNLIKRFKMQSIKPYYIYSEPDGGFEESAVKLGMNHTDFYRVFCSNPYRIILKPRSVVVFDWVRPHDFAKTDALFDNITNKLQKSKAILICFVQLKTEGDHKDQFFAPNLIGQYPSILARYLHNEESENGTKTYIDIGLIRKPATQLRQATIATRFNWKDYSIRTLKEIEKNEQDI